MPCHDEQSVERALKHCETEPVHIPGVIQPHGALIAVDQSLQRIQFTSENALEYLRVGHDLLLGRPLSDVFSWKVHHALSNVPLASASRQETHALGDMQIGLKTLWVQAARAGDLTIFEFEQPISDDLPKGTSLSELPQIKAATSPQELFEFSAKFLRSVTGYDRVMVYAFDGAGHGDVVAEASESERFLGLKFPAWDIPKQARAIMGNTRFRHIADIDAVDVPVEATQLSLSPLDMTHASLRGVSRVHAEYLRNMGALASFSVNITAGDRLWGMISFHHFAPRIMPPETREFCARFGEVFQMKLGAFNQSETIEKLARPGGWASVASMKADHSSKEDTLTPALLSELCSMVQADGAALLKADGIKRYGFTPDEQSVHSISRSGAWKIGTTAISQVQRDFPNIAKKLPTDVAGLLVVKVRDGSTLMFFRRSQTHTVRWTGAPSKNVVSSGRRVQLLPRRSFEPVQQTIKDQCLPWSEAQLRMADGFPELLAEAEAEESPAQYMHVQDDHAVCAQASPQSREAEE